MGEIVWRVVAVRHEVLPAGSREEQKQTRCQPSSGSEVLEQWRLIS
jgi:hypothetical protein